MKKREKTQGPQGAKTKKVSHKIRQLAKQEEPEHAEQLQTQGKKATDTQKPIEEQGQGQVHVYTNNEGTTRDRCGPTTIKQKVKTRGHEEASVGQFTNNRRLKHLEMGDQRHLLVRQGSNRA